AEQRERMEKMSEEWEEKFRKAEIEASLLRAKLARERQQLEQRNAELEEQLAHLQRDQSQSSGGGGSSRKWLDKLGLKDS
ncbi:MAG: hypothetical protein AAFP90_11150, partial [Planctomycetota bacterium]